MNKLTSAIILLALSSVSLNAFSAKNKVDVCHKGKDISVSSKSLSAHMGHGDEAGECDDDSTDSGSDTMAAVVMMRCEAINGNGVHVVSFSTSFDFATIDIEEPAEDDDCAVALADLLDAKFKLRSVTGGSAEDDDELNLYTDYLLIGKISEDEDDSDDD
jgi:hypothetical protein